MSDHKLGAAASTVGGSGGKPGRCFASVAGPQADAMLAPGIALGTTRSTNNALRAVHSTAKKAGAFTLAELVVSVGVLVLLVFLTTQLLNSAATVTTLGHRQMDADSQARQVLDRMAVDFAQMVKRSDVDYYLKSSSGPSPIDCGVCGAQTGNDQAAFYSTVAGYYPTPTATPTASPIGTPPVSLVSYRINSNSASPSYNKMERMGKTLAWNGLSSGLTPVVFLPQTIGGPLPPGPPPGNWPSAVSTSATDSNYEVIGPQVFRFEYYYLLKNGQLSSTPWYVTSSVRGLQDVSAIIVDIAVIDPKSKVLLLDSQLATLAGQLADYTSGLAPGQLLANWRSAIDANTIGLPPPAVSGIRVYERYFYLTH